jgi:hypothetical protein
LTLYNLVDRQGRPFPAPIQASLSQAIATAIADPEADIDLILHTAQGIGERAPEKNIVDLVRYATKAFFRVSRRSRLKQVATVKERETVDCGELSEELASNDHKSIEARVLVAEILQNLPTLERDVLLRFTYGMQHLRLHGSWAYLC